MNNFVLDRIKRQSTPSQIKEPVAEAEVVQQKVYPAALSGEDLRKIFMCEPAPIPETPIEKIDKRFFGIEEFVEWYLPVKTKFTEAQNVPLTSLVQVRDMIFVGCACKSTHRRGQANEYFRAFWTENFNRGTDLPAKVLEVGNFSSVTFAAPQVGDFLKVPTP